MKKAWLWCVLVVLSLGSASISQAQQTSGEIEKAIVALEGQWMESQKTNNPDLLAPLLADKFVYTSGEGKVRDRAGFLALAKAMKFESVEYQDVKVTVFGDTAIATGDFKGKGIDESGKPFETTERWTDTWVKMPDGKWQVVASHGSNTKQ